MQDYDSDLDFEVEPFPSVSSESSNEASACVKVSPCVHITVFSFSYVVFPVLRVLFVVLG